MKLISYGQKKSEIGTDVTPRMHTSNKIGEYDVTF
jgi:hypothetical protein